MSNTTLRLVSKLDALNLARRVRLASNEEPQGEPAKELCGECRYDGVLGRGVRCAWCGVVGRRRS